MTNGRPHLPDEVDILRVRTHLITERDDIVEIARKYLLDVADPGDIAAFAESPVAITQGRAIPPEKIKPSFLARFISRFADPDASLSASRSMQMAIELAGVPRILLACAAQAAGKLVGAKGMFFRVAGHEIAEIDDSGGTMPPYDRHVILGPKDPDEVARRVFRETGIHAMILDTNDKGYVDVLGASFPVDETVRRWAQTVLRHNPFGNDDQQTPLCVIKPRKATAHPGIHPGCSRTGSGANHEAR